MAEIRYKKPSFPVSKALRGYLLLTDRETDVPISYQELLQHKSSITLFDKNGEDTLWETLIYNETDPPTFTSVSRKFTPNSKLEAMLSPMITFI